MKHILIIITSIITIIFSLSDFTYALSDRSGSEYDIYFQSGLFMWNEMLEGDKVVEEKGPIFGIGGRAEWNLQPLVLRVKGNIFGGRVSYDGQTTGSAASVPISSDTEYLGFTVDGSVGWNFHVSDTSDVEIFGGPAIKSWNRVIQEGESSRGTVAKSEENWITLYAPVGIGVNHKISDTFVIFASAGMHIPIYNENEADLRDLYGVKVKVHPGLRISGFAEAGLRWKMLRAALYYEGLRFDESPTERRSINGGTLSVRQPESTYDLFGLSLGVAF